jgi:two-component system sensor histidine kinase DesK
MDQYPERAHAEINDVRLTARSALKEVREMVTQMRGMRLEDELLRIRQILKAAHIELTLEGDPKLEHTSLMNENVLSMCMKEAVTNVVKHSGATVCSIAIEPSRTELTLRIQDNGVGVTGEYADFRGNGLQGMKERLEFVNGSMELRSDHGTALIIKVPNIPEKPNKEEGP